MRIPSLPLALAALATLASACSDSTTNPTSKKLRAPESGASLNLAATVAGKLIVCNSSPVAGTYTYSISVSSSTNATVISNPFTLTAGQCKDAVVINAPSGVGIDAARSATVTQTGVAPGAALDHILKTSAIEGVVDQSLPGPSATVSLNFYHGAVLGFVNRAVTIGCTFTQGYWGNKPGVVWPAPYGRNNPFINNGISGKGNSGLTWQQALTNPPSGGNSYLILASQYIAAVLNKQNGASVPPAVQTVINNAAAYFANVNNGISYVKNNTLNGWADILDAYNNGLAPGGPPHCSEIDAID